MLFIFPNKGSVKVTIEKPASFFVPLIMMNTNFLELVELIMLKDWFISSIGAYSSREIFSEDEYDSDKSPMDMFPGWAKES